MERRRLLDLKGLPSDYTPLTYIRSTGQQYINTQFYPTEKTVLEMQFKYSGTANANALSIARWTGAPTYYTFGIYQSLPTRLTYHYGNFESGQYFHYTGYSAGSVTSASIGDGKCYMNGNLIHTYTNTAFTSQQVLYLLGFNNNGTNLVQGGGYMYYMKIAEDGVVRREFIPAKRIADNVVGMYDLCGSICPLTGTPFYINAGSGTFIGG